MKAAVPRYVGTDFSKAPPGHRFRLYFPVWQDNWEIENQKKKEAVGEVLIMAPVKGLVEALSARRAELAPSAGALTLSTVSTAPFLTGMGMEHPLENGFAFLDPYGVPYLPGSSVKGVVRRAAEELALFETDPRGWTLAAVWWLFGFDASSGFFTKEKSSGDPEPVREERERWKRAYRERGADDAGELVTKFRKLADDRSVLGTDNAVFLQKLAKSESAQNALHIRGSIAFWDVIPVPGKNDAANLRVDIMNPHHSDYYHEMGPPHDADSPNPIFFLTIPPGWSFSFTAQLLAAAKLPTWFTGIDGDRPRWQALLRAAFEHAFDWLGFGAKTSLGYGGMTAASVFEAPQREIVHLADPQSQSRARQRRERPGGGGRPRQTRPVPPQGVPSDPLSAKIAAARPTDSAAIRSLADEIGRIGDEARRRKLALELRSRVVRSPVGRAILNNDRILKKYW